MQDEAEEPTTETKGSTQPTRAEILVVAAAWALFVFTLFAGLRIWSGGSH